MATHRFIGAMQPLSKRSQLVVATPSTGLTYTMTSNEATATYVALSTDGVEEVVAGLQAAAAAVGREFAIIRFEPAPDPTDTDTFYATSVQAGHDFDLSVNANITLTPAQTASGPNFWAADNFDSGALPISNDTVIFEDSNVDLLFNLDQNLLSGVNIECRASYTGRIGWPPVNAAGGFPEYRDRWLKIGSDDLKIGEGIGNGSPRINIDLDATASTAVRLFTSGTSGDSSAPAVSVQNGTSIALTVDAGEIEIGPDSNGPTTTVATIDQAGGTVVLGRGVTATTVVLSAGSLWTESAVTTATVTNGGVLYVSDTAALTTVTLSGSSLVHSSTGNIGTLNLDQRANADFGGTSESGCTITTLNIEEGTVSDPSQRLSITNISGFKTLSGT